MDWSRQKRRQFIAVGRGLQVSYEHRLKQLRLESDLLNTKLVEKIAQLINTKQQLSNKKAEKLSALARTHCLPKTCVEKIFSKLEEVNLSE